MRPAVDPSVNYKKLVQAGYDRCAAEYAIARSRETESGLALLQGRLPQGAAVLDIGCGAGIPVDRELARRCRVTGVDISAEQIRLARENVPQGEFLQADIMAVEFPPAKFDAVISFYALFHLPRGEHAELFRRVRRWLKPGGLFLLTVVQDAETGCTEEDFFGVEMYWSNFGLEDYLADLQKLGFRIMETTVLNHGYTDESALPAEKHPIILAQAV